MKLYIVDFNIMTNKVFFVVCYDDHHTLVAALCISSFYKIKDYVKYNLVEPFYRRRDKDSEMVNNLRHEASK